MKMRRRTVFLKFIVISLIGLLPAITNAQDDNVVVDKIIAKVDNYIVLKSDLERAYLSYLSQGEFRSDASKCGILEQLVVNKMLVAKAEIDSVIVADEEVQATVSQRVDMILSQLGSKEELEKQYNKTIEQIEAELFESMKEQLTIQKMQREITSELKVTPAEVRRFFNKIPQDSLPFFSTEVTVGQIVVKPKAGKAQKEATKKLMYEIRGQLLSGASFATLARKYSDDPGSAARGGELPYYKRGELAPEFEATAMTLQVGELSEPIETQFGFHLIELQERRGNSFKTRHILITPKPSYKDVIASEKFLDSLRSQILIDSIDFQTAAKDHSDDQLTSSNGGWFTDNTESTRVPVDQLDPTIFFTLDTMKVGTISKPMEFQEADGSTSLRIIYYKDRLPPHQANLQDDYQKIATATLNNKQNNILSEWFEEARDKVYIEIDPEYEYCDILKNE